MSKVVVQRDLNAADPFVLGEVKAHLRVTFDDDDDDIQAKARAAAAEFEQVAQMALLNQTIRVNILGGQIESVLRLPIGPVDQSATVSVTADGVVWTDYDLIAGHRPVLLFSDDLTGAWVERLVVEYTAGFGAAASDVPADIAEAVMDQTAIHFDGRSPMHRKDLSTSAHMMRIAARYRGVQV